MCSLQPLIVLFPLDTVPVGIAVRCWNEVKLAEALPKAEDSRKITFHSWWIVLHFASHCDDAVLYDNVLLCSCWLFFPVCLGWVVSKSFAFFFSLTLFFKDSCYTSSFHQFSTCFFSPGSWQWGYVFSFDAFPCVCMLYECAYTLGFFLHVG